MAIPVIDNRTSVLGHPLGAAWSYQPYATNDPVFWKWTGLPEGLVADDVSAGRDCTGDGSTQVISCPGHNFVNGSEVAFFSKTGGSSLSLWTKYFVRDLTGDNFKLAATAEGAAVDLGSSITAALISRVGTGLITGVASRLGVYLAEAVSYNASGESEPLVVTIGVWAKSWTDSGITRLNVDLRNNRVELDAPQDLKGGDAPVAWVKNGDTAVFDVGFTMDGGGSLVPLPLTSIRFGLKEMDTEPILFETDGSYYVVGEADNMRFRIFVEFPQSLASVLSNYENESGTSFNALGEIEWEQYVLVPLPETEGEEPLEMPKIVKSSQTFKVSLSLEILKKKVEE